MSPPSAVGGRPPPPGPFYTTVEHYMADVRDADLPHDLDIVGQLWLRYLTWDNDELAARHGSLLPVGEAAEHDIATIGKFQIPDGPRLIGLADSLPYGS